MLTPRTLVGVPAQGRRPAERQFGQHALHLRHGLSTVLLQIGGRVLPQQVDYAEGLAGPLSGDCGRVGSEFVGGWLFKGVFEGSFEGAAGFGSSHRGH